MERRPPALALQPRGGHPRPPPRQLGWAGAGRGSCKGAAGRTTNAWGPSRASQGVADVPRGWFVSQRAGWCPRGLVDISRGWLMS